MDLDRLYDDWFDSLDEQQRTEALSTTGELPLWMALSLTVAGIAIVPLEITNGDSHQAFLMSPRLTEYLARQRR